MLRIGLTGGIGSGKSAVRDLLAAQGAHIFDADAVAKELMVNDPNVKAALLDLMGPDVWKSDGLLNKPWIAKRIFGSDSLRKAVNEIVHPAVHAAFDTAAREALEKGAPAIVREAALLPGRNQRNKMDRLVAVLAPRAARLQRILERDGMTVSEIEGRMRAQPEDDQYAALADDVIRNDGTLDDLERTVGLLWTSWMASQSEKMSSSGPSTQIPETDE